jgi:hypothetical protein
VDTEKNKHLVQRRIDFSNDGFIGSLDEFIEPTTSATSAPLQCTAANSSASNEHSADRFPMLITASKT